MKEFLSDTEYKLYVGVNPTGEYLIETLAITPLDAQINVLRKIREETKEMYKDPAVCDLFLRDLTWESVRDRYVIKTLAAKLRVM